MKVPYINCSLSLEDDVVQLYKRRENGVQLVGFQMTTSWIKDVRLASPDRWGSALARYERTRDVHGIVCAPLLAQCHGDATNTTEYTESPCDEIALEGPYRTIPKGVGGTRRNTWRRKNRFLLHTESEVCC